jgi:ubiquinone/menaquinone biosynthesis C-methylase UbiE
MSTNSLSTNPTAQPRETLKAAWSTARSRVASLLRRYSWLPAAATSLSCLALVAALTVDVSPSYKVLCVAALGVTSFVWGYWKQATRRRLFPPLAHLHRRQYAATWDQLASSREEACAAAAGRKKDEAEFRMSAAATVQNLLEFAHVRASDQVLEVGCGVGRIGEALREHCSTWTGADISAKMLSHASERLKGSRNVGLVRLSNVGLSEFESRSFDVVYFTNMLMHLDEMDRWQYVEETFRVLRPGGRIFMDIIDIESEPGWAMFTHDVARYKHLERPPYMPRFSTASELSRYVERAGFGQAHTHRRPPLVIVTGIRPV